MAVNTRVKNGLPVSRISTGYKEVGLTATQIESTPRRLTRGVWLKNPAENSNTVFVSEDRYMTAGTGEEQSGYPLQPGESILFPTFCISRLWLKAAVTGPTNISYFYN